jgi:hypothetical protein
MFHQEQKNREQRTPSPQSANDYILGICGHSFSADAYCTHSGCDGGGYVSYEQLQEMFEKNSKSKSKTQTKLPSDSSSNPLVGCEAGPSGSSSNPRVGCEAGLAGSSSNPLVGCETRPSGSSSNPLVGCEAGPSGSSRDQNSETLPLFPDDCLYGGIPKENRRDYAESFFDCGDAYARLYDFHLMLKQAYRNSANVETRQSNFLSNPPIGCEAGSSSIQRFHCEDGPSDSLTIHHVDSSPHSERKCLVCSGKCRGNTDAFPPSTDFCSISCYNYSRNRNPDSQPFSISIQPQLPE